MQCEKCGTQLNAEETTCPWCGAMALHQGSIDPVPTTKPDPTPQPNPQPKPTSTPKISPKLIGGIVCAVVALTVFKVRPGYRRNRSFPEESFYFDLAEAFFGDEAYKNHGKTGGQIIVGAEAMRRIIEFLGLITCTRYDFGKDTVQVEEGQVKYHSRTISGGRCYDGGCYSYEPDDEVYIYVRMITEDEYLDKEQEKKELQHWHHYIWDYIGDIPEENTTEVFVIEEELFMKNPFGLRHCVVIKREV